MVLLALKNILAIIWVFLVLLIQLSLERIQNNENIYS